MGGLHSYSVAIRSHAVQARTERFSKRLIRLAADQPGGLSRPDTLGLIGRVLVWAKREIGRP